MSDKKGNAMKKAIILCLLFFSAGHGLGQADHIHLKNGDIIKGVIIENVINDYIKVELQGGSILTFRYSEIEKIAKETDQERGDKKSTTSNSSQFNTQQMMMYQAQKKSEGTAMIFSFILPSAGHAYAGNWGKGIGFAGAEAGLILAALILGIEENCYPDGWGYEDCYYETNMFFIAGYAGAIATRFYEIFDAGREVKKYNHQLLMQYGINPGFSMNVVPQKRGASLMLAYSF